MDRFVYMQGCGFFSTPPDCAIELPGADEDDDSSRDPQRRGDFGIKVTERKLVAAAETVSAYLCTAGIRNDGWTLLDMVLADLQADITGDD